MNDSSSSSSSDSDSNYEHSDNSDNEFSFIPPSKQEISIRVTPEESSKSPIPTPSSTVPPLPSDHHLHPTSAAPVAASPSLTRGLLQLNENDFHDPLGIMHGISNNNNTLYGLSPLINENHLKQIASSLKIDEDMEIDIGDGPDVPMIQSTGISIDKDFEAEEEDVDMNTPFHFQNQLYHQWTQQMNQ